MATTQSNAPRGDRDFMDWFQVNSRYLGAGAALVLVALIGYWFYSRSRQIRMANAERSLMTAQQSLASGNTSLALSDLEKVVARYEGTSAGTEAALLLAQQYYEQGKYQEGIAQLRKVSAKAGGAQATVESLIGDGQAQMDKPEDAARSYERASTVAVFDNEKAYYRAKAARSYVSAGKLADAKRVWGELAAQQKNPSIAAEAKVRLAELTAQRAGS